MQSTLGCSVFRVLLLAACEVLAMYYLLFLSRPFKRKKKVFLCWLVQHHISV